MSLNPYISFGDPEIPYPIELDENGNCDLSSFGRPLSLPGGPSSGRTAPDGLEDMFGVREARWIPLPQSDPTARDDEPGSSAQDLMSCLNSPDDTFLSSLDQTEPSTTGDRPECLESTPLKEMFINFLGDSGAVEEEDISVPEWKQMCQSAAQAAARTRDPKHKSWNIRRYKVYFRKWSDACAAAGQMRPRDRSNFNDGLLRADDGFDENLLAMTGWQKDDALFWDKSVRVHARHQAMRRVRSGPKARLRTEAAAARDASPSPAPTTPPAASPPTDLADAKAELASAYSLFKKALPRATSNPVEVSYMYRRYLHHYQRRGEACVFNGISAPTRQMASMKLHHLLLPNDGFREHLYTFTWEEFKRLPPDEAITQRLIDDNKALRSRTKRKAAQKRRSASPSGPAPKRARIKAPKATSLSASAKTRPKPAPSRSRSRPTRRTTPAPASPASSRAASPPRRSHRLALKRKRREVDTASSDRSQRTMGPEDEGD